MNYTKIYNNIILNASTRVKSKRLERHHILPESCGGTNSTTNLVYLTTREHFICHMLLVRMYKNIPNFKKKMIYALWWMAKTRNATNGCRVTSRSYDSARQLYSENHPNKCEERKIKFIENHKAGNYKYDYEKVSKTMKKKLSQLTKEELSDRMKKSALSGDNEKRKLSIKISKGSQLQLTDDKGNTHLFWSYDNVMAITGYTYEHIKYKIKHCCGKLNNESTVKYIVKYKGNDNRVGRKRNNSI